jgi:adenylate cyclase
MRDLVGAVPDMVAYAQPASSVDAASGLGPALLDAEDRNQRRAEWRVIWVIAGLGAVASFPLGWTIAPDPDQAGRWLGGLQGFATSLMISIPLVWLEVAGGRSRLWRLVRRRPLWVFLLAKLALYLTVIAVSIQLGRLLVHPINPRSFDFDMRFFEILLYASTMSLIAIAVVEVGWLVGFRELRRLLTGRYIRPRHERRVFLMVDMKSSTAAAERLGDLRFHQLLDMFFRNVADAAYDHGAEIHKYVGDEVILSWPERSAVEGARCALCPFGIARRIERTADRYVRQFGFVPAFRAALHAGDIVAGEMGAMIREIAFVGDTLNTTARLVDVARDTGHDLILSGDLADRLCLPAGLAIVRLEAARLHGKVKPLPVAALRLT